MRRDGCVPVRVTWCGGIFSQSPLSFEPASELPTPAARLCGVGVVFRMVTTAFVAVLLMFSGEEVGASTRTRGICATDAAEPLLDLENSNLRRAA